VHNSNHTLGPICGCLRCLLRAV